MSNINVNDTVRIGKGKVTYRVDSITDGKAFVIGEKSSRNVELSKLVLVAGAPLNNDNVVENAREIVRNVAKGLTHGVFTVVDGEVTKYKSFDRAAFEVSRNHTYVFAAIVVDGAVKAERTRLTV